MHFAKTANIWGTNQSKSKSYDKSIFKQALPTEDLLSHEKIINKRMHDIAMLLQENGQDYLCLNFEDLYESDIDFSSYIFKSTYQDLGIDVNILSDSILFKTLKKSDQNTAHDYHNFSNYKDFIKASKNLKTFNIHGNKEPSTTTFLLSQGFNIHIKPAIKANHYHVFSTFEKRDDFNNIRVFLNYSSEHRTALTLHRIGDHKFISQDFPVPQSLTFFFDEDLIETVEFFLQAN